MPHARARASSAGDSARVSSDTPAFDASQVPWMLMIRSGKKRSINCISITFSGRIALPSASFPPEAARSFDASGKLRFGCAPGPSRSR
jgi:hypothetical protein